MDGREWRLVHFGYRKGAVAVQYETYNVLRDAWTQHSIRSTNPPVESLLEALDGMDEHVAGLAEIPSIRPRIRVDGVKINWKTEGPAVAFDASVELENHSDSLPIKTPLFDINSRTPDGREAIDDDCRADLEILVEEVKQYVNGKRLQAELDLFAEAGTAEGAE